MVVPSVLVVCASTGYAVGDKVGGKVGGGVGDEVGANVGYPVGAVVACDTVDVVPSVLVV